jgi:hypothetical protein
LSNAEKIARKLAEDSKILEVAETIKKLTNKKLDIKLIDIPKRSYSFNGRKYNLLKPFEQDE